MNADFLDAGTTVEENNQALMGDSDPSLEMEDLASAWRSKPSDKLFER